MSNPLAYFLSWRTYATWLHGDDRGSVDREHNVYATGYLEPNPIRQQWETNTSRSCPLLLGELQRQTITDAIEEHCLHKNWQLLAVAVRTNHVHVLVAFPGIAPEQVMTELKAWSTRALRRKGLIQKDAKVWAHHGSTQYLWDDEGIKAAGTYIVEGQDVPH
ncbi:MAG: transposase [Planctomycetota bacterium]